MRRKKLKGIVHDFWIAARKRPDRGGSEWRSYCGLKLRGTAFRGQECDEDLTCVGCIGSSNGDG